jgi:uncharacterized repeat protein (TIGR03803 family)
MFDRKKFRSLTVAVALSVLGVAARAQFTGYYTFNSNYDGYRAYYADYLAQGIDGNLHGTMPTGAWAAPYGSWFDFPIGGTVKIHELQSATGPQDPYAGFTLGIDGNLYGGTQHGGKPTSTGSTYGAIVKVSNGQMSTVYQFTGGANGGYPYAPPIQAPDGNLYGVTNDAGNTGYVYQILLSNGVGTLGWIHPLPSGSRASLILASDGNLYGTIPYSGFVIPNQAPPGPYGAIFQVTLGGVITGIHNLNGASDGSNPWGAVMQAADGNLYGTTTYGGAYAGGTLYRVALNGSNFSVIHSFQFNDGIAPAGGLVQGSDGNIYGLTTADGYIQQIYLQGGGPVFKVGGTIFKTDTTGANFVRMFTFYGSNLNSGQGSGLNPYATPALHTSGTLYGLTMFGGSGPTNTNYFGTYDNGGELFSYGTGMAPFVSVVSQRNAKIGDRISIIGQGFLSLNSISFNGTLAPKGTYQVVSDNFMTVLVPSGATTGKIVVQVFNGTTLTSQSTPYNFTISCSLLLCLNRL